MGRLTSEFPTHALQQLPEMTPSWQMPGSNPGSHQKGPKLHHGQLALLSSECLRQAPNSPRVLSRGGGCCHRGETLQHILHLMDMTVRTFEQEEWGEVPAEGGRGWDLNHRA